MIDIEAFNLDLARETEGLCEREATTLQRVISLDALRRVIDKTPVDTGRAAGNWQLGIASPATSPLEAFGGEAAYERESPKLEEIAPFGVVFLNNNLDYISVLEDGRFVPPDPGPSKDPRPGRKGRVLVAGGFSVQAPQGMVAVTLEELEQQFK